MIPRKCNYKAPIVVACRFWAGFAANDFGRLVPCIPVAMAATPAQRQRQRQRENSQLSPDGCKLTTRGRGATQHASSISFEQSVGFFHLIIMSNLPFFCQRSSKLHGATPATGPRNKLPVSDRRGAVRMFRREFPALSQSSTNGCVCLQIVSHWPSFFVFFLSAGAGTGNCSRALTTDSTPPECARALGEMTIPRGGHHHRLGQSGFILFSL